MKYSFRYSTIYSVGTSQYLEDIVNIYAEKYPHKKYPENLEKN